MFMTPHLDKIYRILEGQFLLMEKLLQREESLRKDISEIRDILAQTSRPTATTARKVRSTAPKKWSEEHEQFAISMARDLGLGSGDWGLRSWADTIRKMNLLDSRSLKHMRTVWKLAHSDEFWANVILSPKNFRKHWLRLKQIKTNRARVGIVPVGLDELTIYEGTKKPQGCKESP